MKHAVVYRDAAMADGRSAQLRLGVSVLVEQDTISWIRPSGDEGELPAGCEVVDAGGTTIVPGMVDGHSHLTLPGGSHWIDRGADPSEVLLEVAEANGELQHRSGVRWARDVGSPRRATGADGQERALCLDVRDRWRGRRDRPYVRAAGTWLMVSGLLPPGLAVEVKDADELVAAAMTQLDDGADLVKLYLDGPDPEVAPWSADEVARVVAAAHERGAKVTAHSGRLSGSLVCARAKVDSIEHGFVLDADVAAKMAENGVTLVTTMTVLKSWLTFGTTTSIPRFAEPENRSKIVERLEVAKHSALLAHQAGVSIVGGTDFGGGSARANQLPWEVECLVEAGLEPWQALGCVTWRGGELLGEPNAGVIAEGGPADFSLVHGDPLTDPTALWRIWRVA
ncbi:MAG TPA: amidohydrolase family protein [Streptosporangiaceae bacterium]|nr:amidohydrolase family protein [Streptosporangiaceae bacterium]